MAIYRLYPTKDTSIANIDPDGVVRDITLSNVGASEILNLYQTTEGVSVSGTASAHILVQFDLTQIPNQALGLGAEYRLRLFDAQHGSTVPVEVSGIIAQVSQTWVEGTGHDMDFYTDMGYANWMSATQLSAWSTPGGDHRDLADATFGTTLPVPFWNSLTSTFYLQNGHENLDADVSLMVGDWVANGNNFGFYIQLDPSATQDLYIKKYHSRHTHFPTKRPYLEVRWADWTGTLSTKTVYVVVEGDYSGTVWSSSSAWAPYLASGTMVTASIFNSVVDPTETLDTSFPTLKPVYDSTEVVRLDMRCQLKDWNPAVALTASSGTPNAVLTNAYYRITNVLTDEVLVPFNSHQPGAVQFSKLSYDDTGNWFKLYMSAFPTGSIMQIDVAYEAPTGSGQWTLINGVANRFRVIDHA